MILQERRLHLEAVQTVEFRHRRVDFCFFQMAQLCDLGVLFGAQVDGDDVHDVGVVGGLEVVFVVEKIEHHGGYAGPLCYHQSLGVFFAEMLERAFLYVCVGAREELVRFPDDDEDSEGVFLHEEFLAAVV